MPTSLSRMAVCLLAAAGAALGAVEPALLSISYMPEPPEIDGTIGAGEWQHAGAITGGARPGSNAIDPNQTTFWLGWDEAHIHIAMRTYFRPGVRPHFVADTMSDNLELGLFPVIANADRPRRLFLNGDQTWPCPATGEWDIDARTAARTFHDPDDTYGFGTTVWELEASFPIAGFPLPRPNAAGDAWRLLLVRNYRRPWLQVHIPVSLGFLNPDGYVRAVLTRDEPAVQFVNARPLLQGRAAVDLRLHNPTGASATLAVALDVENTTTDSVAFRAAEQVRLGPHETARWRHDAPLENLAAGEKASVRLIVTGADSTSYLDYAGTFTLDTGLMHLARGARRSVLPAVDSIAYSRTGSGLYVDHGTGAARVTYRGGAYAMPRLASDHNRVLFTSYHENEKAVWLVDARERSPVMLTTGQDANWMPGDREFVYVHNGVLYIDAIEAGHPPHTAAPDRAAGGRRLLDDAGDCRFPVPSPDGERLLYVRGEGASRTLHIMTLADRNTTILATGELLSPPAWSPDGTRIAFQDGPRIHVADLDGNRRLLLTDGGVQAHPVWSRCGNGIAYGQSHSPHGPWQLRATDIEGAGATAMIEEHVDAGADVRWRCEPVEGEPPAWPVVARTGDAGATLHVNDDPLVALRGLAAAAEIDQRPSGVRLSEQHEAVQVLGDIETIILPDRLGDDLLIRDLDGTVDVSHAGLIVGVLREQRGLLVLAVPAEDRAVSINGSGNGFSISITSGSGPLGAGIVLATWPSELPGQWRLATAAHARMVSGNGEAVEKVLDADDDADDDVVVYLFGRRPDTPLTFGVDPIEEAPDGTRAPVPGAANPLWTLSDVVMDLLGIDAALDLLQHDAVTATRVADRPVAYAAIERVLDSIRAGYEHRFERWAPGDIHHWLDDVVVLLKAKDARREAYARFAETAQPLIAELGDDGLQDILNALVSTLDGGEALTSIPDVEAAAAAVVEQGRAAFDAFSAKAGPAGAQRADALQESRQLVRTLRRSVSVMLPHIDGQRRPAARRVHALAGELLANRHVAEADWRGDDVSRPYARRWWEDIF